MNAAEHYTTRYLEPKDLDQYNALLRYTFQVTEEELTATGWKDDEIKQSKFPVLERADVLGCFDGEDLISQFAVYPGYLRVGSGRAVDHALREKSVRVRYGRSDGSRVRRRQKGNILDEGPAGTGIRAGRAHKNDTKTDRNAVCRPNGRRANKNT